VEKQRTKIWTIDFFFISNLKQLV